MAYTATTLIRHPDPGRVLDYAEFYQSGGHDLLYPIVRNADYVIAASDSTNAAKSECDAVCDGVEDEADINAAYAAGYKHVLLLPGTYYVTVATIDMDVADTILEGCGWSTVITPTAALGAAYGVIEITKDECCVKDLAIDGNGDTVASGCGIHVSACNRTKLLNLLIRYCKNRNVLVDGGSYWTTLDKCVMRENYDDSVVVSASNETLFYNCLIGWLDSTVITAQDGLVLSSADNCLVSGCWLDYSRYPLYVYNSSNCRIIGNQIELGQQHGLMISGDSSGNTVIGNHVRDNGKQTTATYDGIVLANTASKNLIQGNFCYNDTVYDTAVNTNRQRYGVNVSASGCTSNRILGNVFDNESANATAAWYNLGTGTFFSDNSYIARGEVREYSGTIATLTENAYNSVDNPFGQDVLVLDETIYISTKATSGAPRLDCGIGSSATTDYTTVFDDITCETVGPYHSVNTATIGKQTSPILWQNGTGNRYFNHSIKAAAATGMVAIYSIRVMGV